MLSPRIKERPSESPTQFAIRSAAFTKARASRWRIPSGCFHLSAKTFCQRSSDNRWAGTSRKSGLHSHRSEALGFSKILDCRTALPLSSRINFRSKPIAKPAVCIACCLACSAPNFYLVRSRTRPTDATSLGCHIDDDTPNPVVEASTLNTIGFWFQDQPEYINVISPLTAVNSSRTDSQIGVER